MRGVSEEMKKAGGGNIINIGSIYGMIAYTKQVASILPIGRRAVI